jgi:hypothetical protein
MILAIEDFGDSDADDEIQVRRRTATSLFHYPWRFFDAHVVGFGRSPLAWQPKRHSIRISNQFARRHESLIIRTPLSMQPQPDFANASPIVQG